jgi:hypothetical protein
LSRFVSQNYSWIVLTFAAATMVSLVVLAIYYRQSRRASFFFMREVAARRTRYAFWGFLALLGVTLTLLFTPPREGRPADNSAAALPTATPATAASPSPAAALPSTPTPTPSLPRPELSPQARPSPSPTPSPVPTTGPVEGASFSNAILARGITKNNGPLGPADTFPAGGEPVYLFFHYQGMGKRPRWTQVWLRGTTELFRETTPWEWGEDGTAWLFFTAEGGYTPGEYEVRLYIEDNLQLSARFRVE